MTISVIEDVNITLSKLGIGENKNICIFAVSKTQTRLKVYQLTSLPRICVPENHSNYPPILITLLEIIPIYRHCDVTAPPASEGLILTYPPPSRLNSQNLYSAKKTRQHDVDKFMKLKILPRKLVNMKLTSL